MPKDRSLPPSQRSEARAKAYREDDQRRENIKRAARDSYRVRAWGNTEMVNPARANLGAIRTFGSIRKIENARCRTYTVREVAELLGRSVSIYRRWLSLQQIPSPTHDTDDGKVYKMAEVRAFCAVLIDHFDEFNYYRQDHAETKRAMWDAYWAARDNR